MSKLELKVIPVVVFAIAGLLMWLLATLFTALDFNFMLRRPLVGFLIVTGLLLGFAGVFAFKLKHTTVNPSEPEKATHLVTSGVFQFTRNPMYLGLLLLLIAWGFVVQNVLAFIVLPGFVLYMNRFQIMPEERAMMALFGSDYRSYQQRVRRWL